MVAQGEFYSWWTTTISAIRPLKNSKIKLDEDLEYTSQKLDRSVTAPNQIRAVIQCFKDSLFTKLFPPPDRTGEWVPKALIFAKDDNHAEEIVHIVREVFDEGNDFCKKITYHVTGEDPKSAIKEFRISPLPCIAVIVDMIAKGTEIKPVEIIIFMCDVDSEGYYEHMKGAGEYKDPMALNNLRLIKISLNLGGYDPYFFKYYLRVYF